MNTKRLICFLLVAVLVLLCFAGCRNKKEEETTLTPPDDSESTMVEPVPEPEPEPEPEVKEPQTIEIIDTMPESPNALESEEELVIDVPEGSELGGD